MREQEGTHDEQMLERIVRGTPWLLDVLAAVRASGIGGAYVAAGAIRNTVWDCLHGRVSAEPSGDIDVVYFDPSNAPTAAQQQLRAQLPGFEWEVTNQAVIHRWQSSDAGREIAPYPSLSAALASWPETATAVAVRLADDDTLEIAAPFGLADLFELRVRRNPAASNPRAFDARVAAKGWPARWPKLQFDLEPRGA